ncbi:hypothetical protein [Pseudoalteromonas spongiae]|uniref:hypothetical protein n=1 Tax=Pseudoalteromonas spongiae TaxID=298657 RepID=UPI00110B8380|nr:hypothetical protein [Pseudoalteromonas spongiae]TMO83981.1 hypothetical protein CWC15_12690 [Pseudoalteromonas spongiae]
MSVTKLQHHFVNLAKRLNAWRGITVLLAFISGALLGASLLLDNPQMNNYQVGFILLLGWSLPGYFFIASFSLYDGHIPANASWLTRVKHKLAKFFIRILTLIFVLMVAVTLYLTLRLISVFSS